MTKRRSNGEGCIYKEQRSGRWVGKFEIGHDSKGNRRFKTCRAKTEREVRRLLKDLMDKHRAGINVTTNAIKVGDFFEDWFYKNVVNNLRLSTSQSYEMIIRRHIKPQIGNIPLAELSREDVRNFYNFLYADGRLNGKGGLAPKTVENIHLVLSSGINYALNEGLIIKNPLLTVKLRREGKKEIEVFSREEQQKINFYTGLRAGELLGLTWDCINFDKNTVRVNKQVQRNKNFSHKADTKTLLDFVYDTKTKTSTRTIKVLPQLMKDLEKYKNKQDKIRKKLGSDYYRFNLVFPRQDGYFTDTGTFLDNFARIQKKLDIPHRTVHAIRHTFATRALESGVHIKVVSELLGHASIQITLDIYGHVLQDFAEQELAKLEGIYK